MWQEWTVLSSENLNIPPLHTDLFFSDRELHLAMVQITNKKYLEVLSSKDYGNWFLHVWATWLSESLLTLITRLPASMQVKKGFLFA